MEMIKKYGLIGIGGLIGVWITKKIASMLNL